MPNFNPDWGDMSDEIQNILKKNVGSFFDQAKEKQAEFFKKIAQDLDRESYLMNTAAPEKREEHAKNIEFLTSAAVARAAQLELQAANVAKDVFKQIIDVGIGVAAGFLKRFVVIPVFLCFLLIF
jgi:hypothetical protein